MNDSQFSASAFGANLTSTVHLDVYSCKPCDPDIVKAFAQSFFSGGRSILNGTLLK